MTKEQNKKSFVLHIDSLEILEELNDEQAGKLFKAIKDYASGNPVGLSGLLNIAFVPFRNQLNRDAEKYKSVCERNAENGAKGGRPKNPNNPVGAKKADSDNDNDNDKKKENIITVVRLLNKATGKDFKENTEATQKLITARLNEGRTLEDFERVIRVKTKQWKGDEKWDRFLRPQTLFNVNKFEDYLNEAPKRKQIDPSKLPTYNI